MSDRRRQIGRSVRIGFGILGLLFVVVAFRQTWQGSPVEQFPRWWSIATAELLVVVGLAGAGRGWVCLFEGRGSNRDLTQAFYLSQLGKYVPGAIWQAVGQVGLSHSADVSLVQAATAFPLHALTQVAAGGTVGALIGLYLPPGERLLPLLGLLLLFPLRRVWMARALRSITDVFKKGYAANLPSQRAILRSYVWGIWTLLWNGTAFALLASSLDAARPATAAVPAFAAAWTIGFLAVPFPSGIGIREAVLMTALSSPAGVGPLMVASIVHRLLTMIGELLMIALTRTRAFRRAEAMLPRTGPQSGPGRDSRT